MDMFYQDEGPSTMASSLLQGEPITPRTSLTYEEMVKDLIHEEKQYLRDLHMIIKVFREEIAKLVTDPKVIIDKFSCISKVLTVNLCQIEI